METNQMPVAAPMQQAPMELVQVDNAAIVMAQNRAEVDMQIATAHAYPRNVEQILKNIAFLAKMDEETAGSCFYVLYRQGQTIKGISVRMAEIVASQWGNARFDKRIVANDGKTITAQCTAHDLESNVAIRTEVKRRITDKFGKTYSEDMQVTTGNAAMAIAFRNAVMQIVPKALIKKIVDEVDNVANGKAMSLDQSRANAVKVLAQWGVNEDILLRHFGVGSIDSIDQDMLKILRGEMTAIKEGSSTIQETFFDPIKEEEDRKKAEQQKSKSAAAAMSAASAAFDGDKTNEKQPEKQPVKSDK